jgi:enoyl-CoA hydratase/carnithine racemase
MPGCIRVETRPGGVAVLTITTEPVNILSLDVWEELGAALSQLEGDESCKVRGSR